MVSPTSSQRQAQGWVASWSEKSPTELGTPGVPSTSSPQMVSDVLSIKITTGQTQINLTDLTDRVKQAEDRISLNEHKRLAYEKDLKLKIQ